jgi:predicted enzyme related to lactoylglutathione lyase
LSLREEHSSVYHSSTHHSSIYKEIQLITGARYGHTNLIAADWRRLAQFYIDLFGCEVVPPERDFAGEKLDRLTGLEGAHLTGVHLRLPGYGPGNEPGNYREGPTLELFNYSELADKPKRAVNRPGFGHLAFAVDDVHAAREAVLEAGGSAVGEVVTLVTSAGGKVTCCYVTDPEDNIIELQSWA